MLQDVPAPPPSPSLVSAPFDIGESVATGERIGVDPDGHGVIAGGSRTGKSSLVYVLLKQSTEHGQDAPLGQLAGKYGNCSQGWVTEVVSPIMSKARALELSPWLFAAMHQNRFVDMERWIKDRAWVVIRLPSGKMGREGARLTAGVVNNVFNAGFRKVTLYDPQPFYFVIDETQEIVAGMWLEYLLCEGAKVGARVFALAQSLSMLHWIEGFESVVQSPLANTSTQAFFSPDPEDANLIRATLNMSMRYGDMTLDLPLL